MYTWSVGRRVKFAFGLVITYRLLELLSFSLRQQKYFIAAQIFCLKAAGFSHQDKSSHNIGGCNYICCQNYILDEENVS